MRHSAARRGLLALASLALAACAGAATHGPHAGTVASSAPATASAPPALELPALASQGAMVIGRAPVGAVVVVDGRAVRVGLDGAFVFGVGRDAHDPVAVTVRVPGGATLTRQVAVTPRDWPLERVSGVPADTVAPPPAIAARIAREQALVTAARTRDDDRADFAQAFQWPVRGRISGRFGNQRVYVLPDGSDAPRAPHSGMDIAAPSGTPVLAPAAGVVTFTGELYLTGGTVLLDHGHGISSNFLHLSRIDVRPGQRVAQGERIGAVGATGRASGPHLHWGMNWFDTRIDPLLVLGPTKRSHRRQSGVPGARRRDGSSRSPPAAAARFDIRIDPLLVLEPTK